jgi:alginate O-acetyltransferase complex protein AlgI
MDMPRNLEELLSLALWLAGAGHFCVLIASFQVPYRLAWKEDLARLTPFNRKLMWVHGGFAVYTIFAFGVLSLVLHGELMRGERAALALAFFIGSYWLLRIVVDFGYYSHRDWPAGAAFRIGHVLLTSLFVFLSASYLSLTLWHWLKASST